MSLTSGDLRARARGALANNWGIAILAALVAEIILGAAGGFTFSQRIGNSNAAYSFNPFGLIQVFLGGAMQLGLAIFFLGLARKFPVKFETVFKGFANYVKSLTLYILTSIFTVLWTLLFIIPGIVKAYSYSMSFYILADNPQIDANSAINQSMNMMNGNKMRLFMLDLSFIGWFLLSILTFGILFLWTIPYFYEARAQFYEDLLLQQAAAESPAPGNLNTVNN